MFAQSPVSSTASASSSPSQSPYPPNRSPSVNHGKLWLTRCMAPALLQATKENQSRIHDVLSPELEHMIEKDLHRVGWPRDDERYPLLHELLRRITRKLPTYNQSLSFIAAFCLDNVDFGTSQDDTVTACEQILSTMLFAPPYRLHWLLSPRTCFLQQFIDRFDFLFARALPELYARLAEAKFETLFFAMDWFTTFFTNSLSRDCCCLVWDVLIADQLEDALFLCGLAVLRCAEGALEGFTPDDYYLRFKDICRNNIAVHELRAELQDVVRTLIPTGVIPRNHSTIAVLESRLEDPDDVLVQLPFDATFLMRAVQLDDHSRVSLELAKYTFPSPLLDYAFYRAVLLGHARTCFALMTSKQPPNWDCFNETSMPPVRAAALLRHGNILRMLLWGSTRTHAAHKGYLAELAQEIRSVRLTTNESESYSYILGVLEGKICLLCGDFAHSPSNECSTFMLSSPQGSFCFTCSVPLRSSPRTSRRSHACARCRFVFCDRCADTFRTINDKAMRACGTCHHFWGSCACSAGKGFCDHFPSDFLYWSRSLPLDGLLVSTCECEQCLSRFARIAGRRLLPRDFVVTVEAAAESALGAVTSSIKRLGLKLPEDEQKHA